LRKWKPQGEEGSFPAIILAEKPFTVYRGLELIVRRLSGALSFLSGCLSILLLRSMGKDGPLAKGGENQENWRCDIRQFSWFSLYFSALACLGAIYLSFLESPSSSNELSCRSSTAF